MSDGGCRYSTRCDEVGNCVNSSPLFKCCQYAGSCITEAIGRPFHTGEVKDDPLDDSISRGYLIPKVGWIIYKPAIYGGLRHCTPGSIITHIDDISIYEPETHKLNEDAFKLLESESDEIRWTIYTPGSENPDTPVIARVENK